MSESCGSGTSYNYYSADNKYEKILDGKDIAQPGSFLYFLHSGGSIGKQRVRNNKKRRLFGDMEKREDSHFHNFPIL